MANNVRNQSDTHNESELELMRWEDDGGTPASEPLPGKPAVWLPARNRLEVMLLALVVIGAHLLPFSGALGCPLFAADGCRSIAVLFSFLAAFMLTMRVVFQENDRIGRLIATTRVPRLWVIEAIGAAVVLAWLSPIYAVAHGVADASVAALGVAISILASLVVSKPATRLSLGHDLASVFVVLFAFAWCHALPHFRGTPHGEEFLGAVTIGSCSLHSLRTVIEVVAKFRAK
jgi:hypothetical protein